MDAPIVKITPDIASVARLPAGTTHASFGQLVNDRALMELLDQAREQEGAKQGVLASAAKLEERLLWMQRFFAHEAIKKVDAADAKEIQREITYNAVRPTRVAWIVLGAALVLSIFAWSGKRKVLDALAFAGLLGGFAVMTWGIGTRWMLAGRIPAANMYESLLFLAWGVGLFAVRRLRDHAQPARGAERERDGVPHHGADRPPAHRRLHPPGAAGAGRHAVARHPRAHHHGQLLGAGARAW